MCQRGVVAFGFRPWGSRSHFGVERWPLFWGVFPYFDDNIPPFREVSRAEWGAGQGSVRCGTLPVFSSPGPAVPARDGWPGPGTPGGGLYLHHIPYRGVVYMQFFPLPKMRAWGVGPLSSRGIASRPRGHRLQRLWSSSEPLFFIEVPLPFAVNPVSRARSARVGR